MTKELGSTHAHGAAGIGGGGAAQAHTTCQAYNVVGQGKDGLAGVACIARGPSLLEIGQPQFKPLP